jgi:hypothetical protein
LHYRRHKRWWPLEIFIDLIYADIWSVTALVAYIDNVYADLSSVTLYIYITDIFVTTQTITFDDIFFVSRILHNITYCVVKYVFVLITHDIRGFPSYCPGLNLTKYLIDLLVSGVENFKIKLI